MRWIVSLLALAVLLVGAAHASAAPRASDATVRLGDTAPVARAAAAARGHAATWTSRVVRTRRPVHVLGLRWRSAPEHLHGQVRVRASSGRWRRWTEIPRAHSARGSDPVWAGGATAVQLRLRGRGPRAASAPRQRQGRRGPDRPASARRQAGSGPPPIVPRTQWGGRPVRPARRPDDGPGPDGLRAPHGQRNEYAPGDSAAMVLGICRFHRNGNGWDDIGYNFLVDKYGQVFEGRPAGIDQPVVGAQAQGFNAVSTGVANLGTYSDVPQTEQAIDAMSRLLAWKLPLHGAPVTGKVTVTSPAAARTATPRGAAVTFERISGHRDGNETECPGAQLYAQLPGLRERSACGHRAGVAPSRRPAERRPPLR
jgi:hypothetical protein